MAALDERYKNSICEVKGVRNELLTTGRINTITEDSMELIHPDDDKMPLLAYNTTVKIGVFNAKLGFRMLMGVVYISTSEFLRITNLKTLQEFERRGFFRMQVHIPTKIYQITDEGGEPGGEPSPAIPVMLEDISLSGVQISIPDKMEIRDTFAIEVQLFKRRMMFNCRVARVARQMDDGRFYYGCAFYDHTERQMDDLCYDLFQLQRLEMRKRKAQN